MDRHRKDALAEAAVKRYAYDELEVGHTERFTVEITEEKLQAFGRLSGDINPLHNDVAYAQAKGYKDKVVYGMLTASFLSALAGVWLPGERSLIHKVEVEFPKPVFVGDTLLVEGIVKEKNDVFRIIELKVTVKNQNGEKVLRGKMRVQVL